MRILIASNNKELTEYIFHILSISQPDWKLATTDSGKQCVEAVKNGSCPDIIIMGMDLADDSCFKLIEVIRCNSEVPIVVISNDKEIDTLVRAFNAGANDYIAKALNKDVFVARLKALYRRRAWDMQAIKKRQQESLIKE
jgi:DNA-binding response OmpR family regulator